MSVYRSGNRDPGKAWKAEFYHPVTGRRITAPSAFRTKRLAELWIADEKKKIAANGQYHGPSRMTFAEWYATQWRVFREGVAESTVQNDRAARPRLDHWNDWELRQIEQSPGEVDRWHNRLVKRETPRVVNDATKLLRAVLDLAVRRGLIAKNPAAELELQREPPHEDRTLTDDEVDLIERHMRTDLDRLMVRWLASTGMRIGEAIAMADRYVDLERRIARVRWKYERSTGLFLEVLKGSHHAYREVPLTSDLVERIRTWRAVRPAQAEGVEHPSGSPFLFRGARGGHIDPHNWNTRAWKPAVQESRIAEPLPTPHDLRHYYGTKLGEHGVGEANIAALMGHSPTSRMPKRYVQPTLSRLEQARRVMGG